MPGQIIDSRRDTVACLALSHPEKLNAVTLDMWTALADAVSRHAADESLRCVMIRGDNDAFAAGGDLEEFLTRRATLEQAMHYHGEVARALDAIARCPHPTVASIRGPCIGGGLEIAAQCDLRIAARSARFGAPINRAGFSMYPGELAGLLHLVGKATMLEILLEGRILGSEEALSKGLVTRVVPDEQLDDEVAATIQRICDGAPLVARAHKQWIARLQHDAPLTDDELRASFAFLDSEDYNEGLAAFLGKRKPLFKGR